MKQLVYGLFDNEIGGLHMFATSETVLAKDAVMAFLETQVMQGWEGEPMLVEQKKDILSAVSNTKSIPELVKTLLGFGFILNILAV